MFDRVAPFHPMDFFQLKMKVPHFNGQFLRGHALSSIDGELGKLSLGWSVEGLHILCETNAPLSNSQFPDFQSGDALEFLIDCRDQKGAFHLTRYCHHFVCFGKPVEHEGREVFGFEVTDFRGDESHPLCNPEKIKVELITAKKIQIFLPQEVLFGYDPLLVSRLGFCYIIRTDTKQTQTLWGSLKDFSIEQHPSLWPSIDLIP